MLFNPEERERRLRIVERGTKEDFWKVVKDSIEYLNQEDMKEIVRLHVIRKHKEAEDLALIVKSRQDIMDEPSKIIRENKQVFDNFVFELCGKCGTLLKKIKEKISEGVK